VRLSRSLVASILVIVLQFSAAAQVPDDPASTRDVSIVPIELSSRFGLVLVKAEVDGKPATFIMDTGSSHTILSTRLTRVRPLAFEPRATPPTKGSGWVGNAAKIKATVKIGEVVWPEHEFLAMDDLPDISNALGQKADGLLGQDILKQFKVVQIDFKHRRLVLTR